MNKTTLIAFSIIGFAIAAVSCSKTYNCHCVYKTNGAISHEDDHKVSEGSKSKSQTACNQGDASSTTTLSGVTFVNTTECKLDD